MILCFYFPGTHAAIVLDDMSDPAELSQHLCPVMANACILKPMVEFDRQLLGAVHVCALSFTTDIQLGGFWTRTQPLQRWISATHSVWYSARLRRSAIWSVINLAWHYWYWCEYWFQMCLGCTVGIGCHLQKSAVNRDRFVSVCVKEEKT